MNKENIEELANSLIKSICSSKEIDNVKDPFSKLDIISKKMETRIILVRFPSNGNLSGYSYVVDNYTCIYINSNHTLGRQYCSFWHEIYHCMNDEREDNNKKAINYDLEEEKEANHFAFCVLLQRNLLKDELNSINNRWDKIEISDMIQLQNKFRVSMQALIYRLNEIMNTKFFHRFMYITSIENSEKYQNAILKQGLSCDLILPTKDFCVPKSFLHNIYENLQKNRVSWEEAAEVIKVLEDKGVEVKW